MDYLQIKNAMGLHEMTLNIRTKSIYLSMTLRLHCN